MQMFLKDSYSTCVFGRRWDIYPRRKLDTNSWPGLGVGYTRVVGSGSYDLALIQLLLSDINSYLTGKIKGPSYILGLDNTVELVYRQDWNSKEDKHNGYLLWFEHAMNQNIKEYSELLIILSEEELGALHIMRI